MQRDSSWNQLCDITEGGTPTLLIRSPAMEDWTDGWFATDHDECQWHLWVQSKWRHFFFHYFNNLVLSCDHLVFRDICLVSASALQRRGDYGSVPTSSSHERNVAVSLYFPWFSSGKMVNDGTWDGIGVFWGERPHQHGPTNVLPKCWSTHLQSRWTSQRWKQVKLPHRFVH